jgi:hypothetical protein
MKRAAWGVVCVAFACGGCFGKPAVQTPPPSKLSLQTQQLREKGHRALTVGDLARAATIFEDVRRVAEALDDRRMIAESLNDLGGIASRQSRADDAFVLHQKALGIAQELDD